MCDRGAFETTQVGLTFQTNPGSLAYTVGSNAYDQIEVLTLPVGNVYTLATTSPQTVASGIYDWSSWSDGGAISHNITVPPFPATYTAYFTSSNVSTADVTGEK